LLNDISKLQKILEYIYSNRINIRMEKERNGKVEGKIIIIIAIMH